MVNSVGNRGITLIEIVISIFLFAIITLGATMIFKGSVSEMQREYSVKNLSDEAFIVFDYLERCLPSAICLNDGSNRIDFMGTSDSVRFIAPYSDANQSDLARFAIVLHDEKVRIAVSRITRDNPYYYLLTDALSGSQVLGENIGAFVISYFKDSRWHSEWHTASMEEAALPSMIRVEITVSDREIEGERIEETFKRYIAIER